MSVLEPGSRVAIFAGTMRTIYFEKLCILMEITCTVRGADYNLQSFAKLFFWPLGLPLVSERIGGLNPMSTCKE